jgi:hypoxanthine phosphoribosyltransferase
MEMGIENKMETFELRWEDIEEAVIHLASFLKEQDVKYVVGVPRGGLIPAVMISHQSGIPLTTLDKLEVLGISKEQVAIVDDISDSGVTLALFITQGYTVVTLCHKFTCPIEVSNFKYQVQETDWVVFPWERKDAKQIADYLDK